MAEQNEWDITKGSTHDGIRIDRVIDRMRTEEETQTGAPPPTGCAGESFKPCTLTGGDYDKRYYVGSLVGLDHKAYPVTMFNLSSWRGNMPTKSLYPHKGTPGKSYARAYGYLKWKDGMRLWHVKTDYQLQEVLILTRSENEANAVDNLEDCVEVDVIESTSRLIYTMPGYPDEEINTQRDYERDVSPFYTLTTIGRVPTEGFNWGWVVRMPRPASK